MSLSAEQIHKLLELWAKEESAANDAHHRSVQFHASLISALLAATIAGAMNAKTIPHLLLLLVGPVLVVLSAQLAVKASSRHNLRFIEAVSIRAKLEQALGLCDPLPIRSEQSYWAGEPVIAPRHTLARNHYASSEEFIAAHLDHGVHADARELFRRFGVVGVVLAMGLLVLAILAILGVGINGP